MVAGRTFRYRQPGTSTQPNGEVCQKMLNWAFDALGQRDDDLLELYCGNGNFTLPLATRVRRVLATEISKTSVNAALANIADNGIGNIELVRLSAEELFAQALDGVQPFRRLADIDLKSYQFGSVFVDPPRAGMDPDTCELTRRFERILYVSSTRKPWPPTSPSWPTPTASNAARCSTSSPTPTTWKPGCCWSAAHPRPAPRHGG
ncbi:tRNA/tmRNA (uracil-C(5))-methyltransferase [Stutzerimonas stutzeri]